MDLITDRAATEQEPGYLGWDSQGPIFAAPEEHGGPPLGPARMAAAMAAAGAPWWPRANSTIQRAPVDGGSMLEGPGKGLWHSTETSTWPGYTNNVHPHLTVHLEGGRFKARQHIPFTRAARALRNEPGGVQTNRLVRCQVEIVTRADIVDDRGLPAAMQDGLGELAAWLKAQWGVPASCTVTFRAYNGGRAPTSYGLANGVRLSAAAWQRYAGWLGHMHVPENTHGDPGAVDPGPILRAEGLSMAESADILKAISNLSSQLEVLGEHIYNNRPSRGAPEFGTPPGSAGAGLVRVLREVQAVKAAVDDLAGRPPVDPETARAEIRAAVIDVLSDPEVAKAVAKALTDVVTARLAGAALAAAESLTTPPAAG